MGTVKETVKAGAKLGLFQKLYKQLLKFSTPKEAKKAAEAAIKKGQESAKKTIIKSKEKAKKIKETETDKINKEKIEAFGEKVKKVKKGAIIGGGGTVAADLTGYGMTGQSPIIGPIVEKVKEKTGFKKGGYVKMKRGGSVKKRAKSSSKKSRGTGAAIRGTKFKGVF